MFLIYDYFILQTLSDAISKFEAAELHNPWAIFKWMQLTPSQQSMVFLEVDSYLERLRFLIGHSTVNRRFNVRNEAPIPKKYKIMIHDVTSAFGVNHRCNMTKVGAAYYWQNPPMLTRSSVQPLSLLQVLTAASPLPPVMPEEFVEQAVIKTRRSRSGYTIVQDDMILRCSFRGINVHGRFDWAGSIGPAFQAICAEQGWSITNQQMKDRQRFLADKNEHWKRKYAEEEASAPTTTVATTSTVGPASITSPLAATTNTTAAKGKKRARLAAHDSDDSDEDEEDDACSYDSEEATVDEESSRSSSLSGADAESIMSEVRIYNALCFILCFRSRCV